MTNSGRLFRWMLTLGVAGVLVALATTGTAVAAGEPNLRIVATHVTSDTGSIIVWVYDKADAWLGEGFRTQRSVRVAGNRVGDTVTVELTLPPGEYAFTVFHDVNDDGRLERSFIGLPQEPSGLSNNIRPRFGPPRYKNARFQLGTALVEQRIELR